MPESRIFDEERQNLITGLHRLIEQERITNEYYDAILLDEAHDYLREEIELVRTFTRNLFSVADRRQQIYRRDPQAIDFLRSFSTTINLPFSYRSGVKICRLADEVMKGRDLYSPLEPTSHYREAAKPSSVEYTECDSIERQCELMVNKLQTQLEAYPNELLGVVLSSSPRIGGYSILSYALTTGRVMRIPRLGVRLCPL